MSSSRWADMVEEEERARDGDSSPERDLVDRLVGEFRAALQAQREPTGQTRLPTTPATSNQVQPASVGATHNALGQLAPPREGQMNNPDMRLDLLPAQPSLIGTRRVTFVGGSLVIPRDIMLYATGTHRLPPLTLLTTATISDPTRRQQLTGIREGPAADRDATLIEEMGRRDEAMAKDAWPQAFLDLKTLASVVFGDWRFASMTGHFQAVLTRTSDANWAALRHYDVATRRQASALLEDARSPAPVFTTRDRTKATAAEDAWTANGTSPALDQAQGSDRSLASFLANAPVEQRYGRVDTVLAGLRATDLRRIAGYNMPSFVVPDALPVTYATPDSAVPLYCSVRLPSPRLIA